LRASAGLFFIQALKKEIAASSVWTESQKVGILETLRTVLVKNWHFSNEAFDFASNQRSELTFFQKCMVFPSAGADGSMKMGANDF
jgi:hypothetical protein